MKLAKLFVILLLLGSTSLYAGGDGSTNTAATGNSNIQPAAGTKTPPPAKTTQPAKTSVPAKTTQPATDSSAALKKRIRVLEQQIANLNRLYNNLRAQMVTKNYVWQTAATVVNRAFGKTASNPTRVPMSKSTGGVKLAHIIVGKDIAAGQPVGKNGVRCTVITWGGKYAYRAYLYIYAVPVTDIIMRPKYLIHADDNVPCFKGRIQTHYNWKGHTVKGVRMTPGKYKIFVRIIVYARNGKRVGQAMRFWGDSRPDAYALSL